MRWAILTLASVALACSGGGLSDVVPKRYLSSEQKQTVKRLVSDDEENQVGLQIRQELEQKRYVRYLDDPDVNEYVARIAARILGPARKERPDAKWDVKVVDDPGTVNAVALPGGCILIYSGLLLAADDAAEVAGALAHEAGHVVARHAKKQLVSSVGLEKASELAQGKNSQIATQLAATIARKGALVAYGRSEETEADEYAARYSSAAGYDPHGIARLFEKLLAQENERPAVLRWLSNHPATPDRIKAVNRYIGEHGLGGAERDPEEHEKVKRRLERHPA